MKIQQRRNCFLWSGGKDSYLAFMTSGLQSSSCVFVTFVPKAGIFRCHPLGVLAAQSKKLCIPHEFVIIDLADVQGSYVQAFKHVIEKFGVEHIFSGDILSHGRKPQMLWDEEDVFHDRETWWTQFFDTSKIAFSTPLSSLFAEDIIQLLEEFEIEALVTGLTTSWWTDEFLGKRLTLDLLRAHWAFADPKFDLCGELGEYHTTVVAQGALIFCESWPATQARTAHNGNVYLKWGDRWSNPPLHRVAPMPSA
jgi:diphthamide synthase (EF-2-diphthine--ammonia ligase)